MTQSKSRQRGLSFLGLLVIGGLLAVVGVLTAQVVPTVMEYRAVVSAANKASGGNSVAEIRSLFNKAVAVDDIKSITGKEIEISKEGDKIIVSFAYQREIHLVGPGYLTLKYSGSSR
jgi:Domain of unknown function (DUF4845)